MLLTELAVQNLVGFPATSRIPLKGGLNALVGREADVLRVVRGVLYPSLESGRSLCVGAGPNKAACTLIGRDGATWRVVRDFGSGAQSLLRSDPVSRQAQKISEDPAEIAQHLTQSAGLPPEGAFKFIFSLASGDLPSRHALAGTGPKPAVAVSDGPPTNSAEAKAKLPMLREELARAERLEKAQDEVYELQNLLAKSAQATEPVRQLEAQSAQLRARSEAAWQRTAEVNVGLEQKVRRYPEAQSRRDTALAEVVKKREDIEKRLGAVPKLADLTKDPLSAGGILAGLLASAAAFSLEIPSLYLLNLVAFGVAAFGLWRFVDSLEEDALGRQRLADLNELEKRIHAQYTADTEPVKVAMKAFGASNAAELLQHLEERDLLEARRVAVDRELEQLRADPALYAAEYERASLAEQLRARELEVQSLGFSREAGVVRREVQLAEEFIGASAADENPLPVMLETAAALAGQTPPTFIDSFKERLQQYLGALTDRRFVGVRALSPGVCHVVAANGASGMLPGLPPAEQDAIVVALRLALSERLGGPAKMPLFFDETSLLVPASHRGIVLKMLKSLGAQTQVLLRSFEPPAPGVVDHVAFVAQPSDAA